MARLALPHIQFKESYINAVVEFQREDLWTDLDIPFLQNRFEDYVIDFDRTRKGMGLPLGWVPATEYWWVQGDEFLGRIDIRHRLTDALKKFGGHIGYEVRPTERKKGHGKEMLKAVLPCAKEMRIEKLLITCDSDNIASQRMILSVGGVFQDEIMNEGKNSPTQRYWVGI
jgi:predicted acetyltransferase